MFSFTLLCVLFSLSLRCNHLVGEERELVALFCLSSLFLVVVIVLWLFLTVPRVGLRCVIVVFPDHTPLLSFKSRNGL